MPSSLSICPDPTSSPDLEDLENLQGLLAQVQQERQEANHRIANSLEHLASLLRVQRSRIDIPASRYLLLTVELRLLGIARIHQRVSEADRDGSVQLPTFLGEVAADLESALGIELQLACDDVLVRHRSAGQLGIVINELVMNAAKHAYGEGGGGSVHIDCRSTAACLRLIVADQGNGLPDGFDLAQSRQGLGMAIVSAAIARLGGTLTATNAGGAVFTIEMPMEPLGRPDRPDLQPDAQGHQACSEPYPSIST